MKRIAASTSFPLLASYVYPGEPIEEVRQRIANYKNVHDFQTQTMARVNERVIEDSITEFTCDGISHLSPHSSYLYVSNHRDIMLDSSLLQYYFVTQGFDTTEITFGANLMSSQLVIDIGKCNKMFKVERPAWWQHQGLLSQFAPSVGVYPPHHSGEASECVDCPA